VSQKHTSKSKPTETAESKGQVMFDDEYVALLTYQSLAKQLRGILKADDARDLTSELLEERRLEAKRKWF
jgi:RecB family endonuclease NucS